MFSPAQHRSATHTHLPLVTWYSYFPGLNLYAQRDYDFVIVAVLFTSSIVAKVTVHLTLLTVMEKVTSSRYEPRVGGLDKIVKHFGAQNREK